MEESLPPQPVQNSEAVLPPKKPFYRKKSVYIILLLLLIIILLGTFLLIKNVFTKKPQQIPITNTTPVVSVRVTPSASLRILSFHECLTGLHEYQNLAETDAKEASDSAEKTENLVQDCRWTMGTYKDEIRFQKSEATESALPVLESAVTESTPSSSVTPSVQNKKEDYSYVQVVMPSGNAVNDWMPVLEPVYKFRFSYPNSALYTPLIDALGATITIKPHQSESGIITIETTSYRREFETAFRRVTTLPVNTKVTDAQVIFPQPFIKLENLTVDRYEAFEFTSEKNGQKIYGTAVHRNGRFVVWTNDEKLVGIKNDMIATVVFLDNSLDLIPLRNNKWVLYRTDDFPVAFHHPEGWNLVDTEDKDNSGGRTLILTDQEGNNGVHLRTNFKGDVCKDKECVVTDYPLVSGIQGKKYVWQGGIYFLFTLPDNTKLFAEPIYGTVLESLTAVVNSLYTPDKNAPVKIEQTTASVSPLSAAKCPAEFDLTGNVKASGKGTVLYKWFRSDGAIGPLELIYVNGVNTYLVQTTWTLSPKKFSGWEKLQMISPSQLISNPASFTLTCLNESQD
ncbi:MAG: hypothetical protein Q8Q49_00555 [bacterium]|nr:hypothetical protein [bacterium]